MTLYVEDQLSSHFKELLEYVKKAEHTQKRSAIPDGQPIPGESWCTFSLAVGCLVWRLSFDCETFTLAPPPLRPGSGRSVWLLQRRQVSAPLQHGLPALSAAQLLCGRRWRAH
jgi:hypothetical protein